MTRIPSFGGLANGRGNASRRTSVMIAALHWLISSASAQTTPLQQSSPEFPASRQPFRKVWPDPKAAGELFKSLGPLSRDLFAAYSMDRRENGSLVFSRIPTAAIFSGKRELRGERGRQSADFTGDNAVMIFDHLRLGPAYTLSGWVFLPSPGRFFRDLAVRRRWRPSHKGSSFMTWNRGRADYCSIPKTLDGWHHVARGLRRMPAGYLPRWRAQGALPFALGSAIRSAGNDWKQNARSRQASRLDDLLFFTRDLTKAEIARQAGADSPEPGARGRDQQTHRRLHGSRRTSARPARWAWLTRRMVS